MWKVRFVTRWDNLTEKTPCLLEKITIMSKLIIEETDVDFCANNGIHTITIMIAFLRHWVYYDFKLLYSRQKNLLSTFRYGGNFDTSTLSSIGDFSKQKPC